MIALPLDAGPPLDWARLHGLPVGASMLVSGDLPDLPTDLTRWSTLCLDPVETLVTQLPDQTRPGDLRPFEALEALQKRAALASSSTDEDLPCPLVTCALSYDLGRTVEALPVDTARAHRHPDLWAARYEAAYVYDHHQDKGWLVGASAPAIDQLRRRLKAGGPAPAPIQPGPARALMSRADYTRAIHQVLDAITEGELYQMNMTVRFEAPLTGAGQDPAPLFARLMARTPVPFGFCFRPSADLAWLGATPERFLRWTAGGHVETRPIKGTRPRGATPEADAQLARALAASIKDAAEHVMIVDLERNDLGRVCEPGTVKVSRLKAPEAYATVHHLVSTVEGRLKPGAGLSELLRATFPGGSITGAPRLRAMEHIEALEPIRRGLYCGAAGYLDARGGGDLALPIRTAWIEGDRLAYQAGGGIVADSEADAEWAEVLTKAQAFFDVCGGFAE